MYNKIEFNNLTYRESVDNIVEIYKQINAVWSNASGWAPPDAAELLEVSRLDWLVSLSHSLYNWEFESAKEAQQGNLILAWVNLGALVEGSLKLFLSVYYEDYTDDVNAILKKGKTLNPDGVYFDRLIHFFKKSVWTEDEREERTKWLDSIRDRRNAVHAYQDRPLDDLSSFHKQVNHFVPFLIYINSRLPYPDR